MNTKQWAEFRAIMHQCSSGQFRSINVSSKTRSDAIIAAWDEIEQLKGKNRHLYYTCLAAKAELELLLANFGTRWPSSFSESAKQCIAMLNEALLDESGSDE